MWVADRVDEALEEYREAHGIAGTWETRERVVVAITGAPGGDDVIRRAARMAHADARRAARRARAAGRRARAGRRASALDEHRRLLAELGGEYHEVAGDDVADGAGRSFARAENAHASSCSARAGSRGGASSLRGSVINGVLRAVRADRRARDLDRAEPRAAARSAVAPAAPRRRASRAGAQLVGWVLARRRARRCSRCCSSQLRDELRPAERLAPASCCSSSSSRRSAGFVPALVAAVGGFLLANWFFTPPFHTFTIAEGENLLALVVFLVVGGGRRAGSSAVAARRTAEAAQARAEAETLAALGGTLVGDRRPAARSWWRSSAPRSTPTRSRCCARGRRRLGRRGGGGRAGARRDPRTPTLARAARRRRRAGRRRRRPRPTTTSRCCARSPAQVAVAVERRRLRADAAAAAGLAEANELRTALLAAVSHDLRTPLASIKASVTSLLQRDVDWTADGDRASSSRRSTRRPTGSTTLVGNLLDMSRLQTGALQLVMRDVGLEEVVPARARRASATAPVAVDARRARDAAAGARRRRRCSSGRSRTSSTTRCAWSPPDQPVRVEAGAVARPGRPARRRPRPGHPAPTSASACSSRSSGSATIRERHRRRARPRRRARASSRRWAASSRSRTRPVAASTMVISLPAVRAVSREPRARRRRRAADPARARHQPAGPRLRGRPRARPASRRSTLAARHHPDVVVLDLGLPGIDGVEVIRGPAGLERRCRSSCCRCATPRRDKVAALDAGADDYVTKPFGMDELLARLRAALRRATPAEEEAGRRRPPTSRSTSRPSGCDARRRRGPAHARPSGTSSRCSCATRASSSRSGSCCRRCGAPSTTTETQLPAGLHGPGAPQARARTRRARATSSPSPGMGYRFELAD